MSIEEGLRLLKEAYDEYEMAWQIARRAKGEALKEYEHKMSLIHSKVESIFMTCPQLKSYIDYRDMFFSHAFFRTDLQKLVDIISKDLNNS